MSAFKEKLNIVNGICSLEMVPDKIKTDVKLDLANYWMIYESVFVKEMYGLLGIPDEYALKFYDLLSNNKKIKTGRDFRSISAATQVEVLDNRNRLIYLIRIPVKWYIAHHTQNIEMTKELTNDLFFLIKDMDFEPIVEFICRFCKTYIGCLRNNNNFIEDSYIDRRVIDIYDHMYNKYVFENYKNKDEVLNKFISDISSDNESAWKKGEERANIIKEIEDITYITDDIYNLYHSEEGAIDDKFKSKVMELDNVISSLKNKINI